LEIIDLTLDLVLDVFDLTVDVTRVLLSMWYVHSVKSTDWHFIFHFLSPLPMYTSLIIILLHFI